MKKILCSFLAALLVLSTSLTLLPTTVYAAGIPTVLDLSLGSITIGDTGASGGGLSTPETELNPAGYLISQTNSTTATAYTISVATSTSLTLSGVNVDGSATPNTCAFSVTNGAAVSIALEGSNALRSGTNCAGLQVPDGNSISLQGTGSLTVYGGEGAAGIGGGFFEKGGTVTISSGTVTTTGGAYGAGIGGGDSYVGVSPAIRGTGSGVGGTVTISGGNVTARGGTSASGIGGGWNSHGGTVTISGGTVSAFGASNSAGIGGGWAGNNGTVTINGGTVVAIGGATGNGIGGGIYGTGGTVTISGGSVQASSIQSPPKDTIASDVYPLTLKNLPANANVSALTVSEGGASFAYGKPAAVHSDGSLCLFLPANGSGMYYDIDLVCGGISYGIDAAVESGGVVTILSPNQATFDKNINSVGYADIAVTFNGTLNAVANGASVLAAGTDYTIIGSNCTIKKEYLAKQPTGTMQLIFDFSLGTDLETTVTLSDSTPQGSGAAPTLDTTPMPVLITTTSGSETTSSTSIAAIFNRSTHTVTASLSPDIAQDLLDEALAAQNTGKKAVVHIAFGTVEGETRVNLELPRAQLKQMAAAKATLLLDSGMGTITLSANALNSIANAAAAGNVTLGIEQVNPNTLSAKLRAKVKDSPLYRFEISVGNTAVTRITGGAKISIPYTPSNGASPRFVTTYYIDSKNVLRSVRGTYDKKTGTVSFSLTRN